MIPANLRAQEPKKKSPASILARAKGIVVQSGGQGLLAREESLVFNHASVLHLPCRTASVKEMERGRFQMADGIIPIGSIQFIRAALRQLDFELPKPQSYPSVLAHLLYRQVSWFDSLASAVKLLDDGQPLFVKPADRWKSFTGFVIRHPDDIRLSGKSRSSPVWVSSIVDFQSEWRAYVSDHKLLDLRFVDDGGDRRVEPDIQVVLDAISRLQSDASTPRGYVIDFGVLATSQTALVEMNDGFAFGAYDGLPASVLWEVAAMRFLEITGQG
ncbi:ATP-grasp domain-containing protein [Achromobacter anxifer]|uniref:ATP-grasp domain-containing protein n=1 Tax=Achromobacter anxifer TaxID=1287737 RepID=UPI0023F8CB23|nr:ATP-grasp domain-containing protein [Achromobacter anxifer]MDF8364713.1 ATP-grasp domain-containing protein [Achromobacter anxifer]